MITSLLVMLAILGLINACCLGFIYRILTNQEKRILRLEQQADITRVHSTHIVNLAAKLTTTSSDLEKLSNEIEQLIQQSHQDNVNEK